LRRSNWIEDLVFPAAVAVLTTAWVHLWLVWVARAGLPQVNYPPVSPLLLALLLAGAAVLTRYSLDRSGGLGPARSIIVGVGLAAIAFSLWWTFRFGSLGAFLAGLADWGRYISPVLAGLVACAFMWWQGIVLAVAHWPQQHMERSFYFGIGGLAALFVANQSRPVITATEAVSTTVALFGAGLGALALVSFENARRYHEGTTGTRLSLNRYWVITVASVIGAILLAALLAATLFSPAAYVSLGRALAAVLDTLTFALVFVLAAVVAVIIAIVFPIMQAILNFGPPSSPDEFIPFDPARVAGDRAEEAVKLFADNPALAAGRQVLFLVLLAAGVGLLLWWSVRRLGSLNRKDSDEVRDSIATRELVLDQLRALFTRRLGPAETMDPYLALAGSTDDPRLIVRRAYQSMLEWAHTVAHERTAGQTPASYGELLARAVPQGRDAIATLTLAYERARYGAEPLTLEEARTAQGALTELQSAAGPTSPTSFK
jgi:hypothetical protein